MLRLRGRIFHISISRPISDLFPLCFKITSESLGSMSGRARRSLTFLALLPKIAVPAGNNHYSAERKVIGMNYEKFCQELAEEVKRQAGRELRVKLQKISKNNGVEADALEIQAPGSRFSPILYLEDFYEQYLRGVGVSHLAALMLDCYEEFRKNPPASEKLFFETYQQAAPEIYCKLVNYEKNLSMMEQIPHERWLDLAVVYYYQMELPKEGAATILIRNTHLKQWNIPGSRLRRDAWENTLRKLTPTWKNLSEVLAEEADFQLEEDQEPPAPVYLLTNVKKCLGAICIHYPRMTEMIAGRLKSDYYVLPSSIHECLILPAEGFSGSQLRSMVREINETRLPPQEVLSDQVYFYDRHLRRLTVSREL